MFFTSSSRIKETSEYKRVCDVISKLDFTGVTWLGRGHCISMAEILRNSLSHFGIKSSIVECQLLLIDSNHVSPTISYIGYDGVYNPGEIDTHVVVITDTKIPMMIDASIGHRLSENNRIIIDELKDEQNLVFCDIELNGIALKYQKKLNPKVAVQYQTSILDRMNTDRKVFKNIKILKILIIIALLISTLNATRGFYDFYQKYFNDESMIGVSGFRDIEERIEELEKKLLKSNN